MDLAELYYDFEDEDGTEETMEDLIHKIEGAFDEGCDLLLVNNVPPYDFENDNVILTP